MELLPAAFDFDYALLDVVRDLARDTCSNVRERRFSAA
jgi:hypothetical protein